MSFETIPAPEHPAISAARAIRKMHEENIALIDGGFVFHDKDGVSVNEHMRAACVEQLELCDKIIGACESLPADMLKPIELMLNDQRVRIGHEIEQELEAQKELPSLPEIGNYDNDEKA